MQLWAGLGYYSRARNLHAPRRRSREIAPDHFRAPPMQSQNCRYWSLDCRAIAASCFDERVPILDGNVKRVLARHGGIAGDPATRAVEVSMWDARAACCHRRGRCRPIRKG